uniref:Uncharacterized protein n=1 Tax=Macrostomum lignano TaxID=282301 RepID=A0A1I8JMQ3_9PLAT
MIRGHIRARRRRLPRSDTAGHQAGTGGLQARSFIYVFHRRQRERSGTA